MLRSIKNMRSTFKLVFSEYYSKKILFRLSVKKTPWLSVNNHIYKFNLLRIQE